MHRSLSLPPLNFGVKGKGHHTRSDSSETPPQVSHLPRMSVLASVKFPSLRRSDSEGSSSSTHKTPLLTLKLSSHSFLDSTLKDDSSSALYTIRTVGMTTTIHRLDPWDPSNKTADIKWPKFVPAKTKGKGTPDGVLVRLAGSRWKGGDSILKQSTSKSGSRKFSIPYCSHSMKWQKRGMSYWCTSPPVKGPIATFDPPVGHLPGRLTVYETLHDETETSPMFVHKGVSILLLDYLLVTAILLVTDVQEWMLVQTQSSNTSSIAESPRSASRQWRKIAHREPLFTKHSPTSKQSSAGRGDFDNDLNTCDSQEQMGSLVPEAEGPEYPRFHPGSKSMLSFSSNSDQEDGGDSRSLSRTRSPNASAESLGSPFSENLSARHTNTDLTLHFDPIAPPVPPLPTIHAAQARSPSSALSSVTSRPVRGLPALPPQSVAERSSPVFSDTSQLRTEEIFSGNIGPADALLWKRRPSEPITGRSLEPTVTRSRSVSRPLPRTPITPSIDLHTPPVRRVQSHHRISQDAFGKPWLSASTTPVPPLPPLPSTPAAPRTLRADRSLPPTPLDLAMGRPEGGVPPVSTSLQNPYKISNADENTAEWVEILQGEQSPSEALLRPSFDVPPPAYSSIDFH